jgi:hypothetical protein
MARTAVRAHWRPAAPAVTPSGQGTSSTLSLRRPGADTADRGAAARGLTLAGGGAMLATGSDGPLFKLEKWRRRTTGIVQPAGVYGPRARNSCLQVPSPVVESRSAPPS